MASIFTKIINRELPATIRYEDDNFIAFDDIKPSAPFDIVIATKKPFETLNDVPESESALMAGLLETARKTAKSMGFVDNYRLVMNVGQKMQLIKHIHIHLMGGWDLQKIEKVKLKNI
jgi:histidine triad (HIT) family protein